MNDNEQMIEEKIRRVAGCNKENCEGCTFCSYYYAITSFCENNVVLTKDEYETICFNLEESQRQGKKTNDMYGQCLMAYNLVKDENEKLKTKLKKAFEKVKEALSNVDCGEQEYFALQNKVDEICKEIIKGEIQ